MSCHTRIWNEKMHKIKQARNTNFDCTPEAWKQMDWRHVQLDKKTLDS